MKIKQLAFTPNFFETRAWAEQAFVCGIDEVGRGCLAGPLVVAAVILPQNTVSTLLKDSKVLDEKNREKAYDWIIKNCWYQVAFSCNYTIDQVNIYQATLSLMKKTYISLLEKFDHNIEDVRFVVVDAMPLILEKPFVHSGLEVHYFNYGESVSQSIAAASIVAKVTRDRLISKMHTLFPAFAFAKHKGYGTPAHIATLLEHGPSLLHRTSFISNIKHKVENYESQQVLF